MATQHRGSESYRKYGIEEEGLFKRHYRRRYGELWDNYGTRSGWVSFSTKNHPGPLTVSTEEAAAPGA